MFRVGVAAMVTVATTVVGGCGASGSVTPPTFDELLAGVKELPATVPGLSRPMVPYGPHGGGVPSARECSAIWNLHAPRRTVRWVASRSADRADVTLFTSRYQVIGHKSEKGTISNCAYGIAVAPTQILVAVAPQNGTAAAWEGELLTYRSTGTVTHLAKRFNATVNPNGTIRLG